MLGFFSLQLRWEWAVSDPCGICLHDPKYLVDDRRTDPDADSRATRCRVRRRDERIRAVIHVELRPLGSLQQDPTVIGQPGANLVAGLDRVPQQLGRHRLEPVHDIGGVGPLL